VLAVLKETITRCHQHKISLLASSLAFYTLLSLAPGLWIVVAGASIFIDRQSVRAEAISWANEMIGPRIAGFVDSLLDGMAANSSFATVAGVLSMFFGATVAFSALQDSLNLIWDVPPRKRGHVARFFIKRMLSFGAVVVLGVFLLASLFMSASIAAAARFAPHFLPAPKLQLEAANFVAAIILLTLLFGLIYRILPDATVLWRDAWTGAAVTALLFSVGRAFIGLYLDYASSRSAYGAAGSLVVVLLWVYCSAQIFLFGAEFTEVYARRRLIAP
jgi:membrane protein